MAARFPSPHPIAETLPGLYQGHSFVSRFCEALDEVLSPVLTTLDNLPAYLDVGTAPPDVLPWLAYWTGTPVDPGHDPGGRRTVLQGAKRLQGRQGTAQGVEVAVHTALGWRTVVEDSGGAEWALDPDAPLPGAPGEGLVVRVFVPTGRTVSERRLERLVASVTPAHVPHRVEVVAED